MKDSLEPPKAKPGKGVHFRGDDGAPPAPIQQFNARWVERSKAELAALRLLPDYFDRRDRVCDLSKVKIWRWA